jgi:hypothetical protein
MIILNNGKIFTIIPVYRIFSRSTLLNPILELLFVSSYFTNFLHFFTGSCSDAELERIVLSGLTGIHSSDIFGNPAIILKYLL